MKKALYFIIFVAVKFIYCAAALIIFFPIYSNAQEMAIRVYTAKDGLPSTYVLNTYQDKLGYLWVGSPDGLSRFDGKYFKSYAVAEGLPDTRVNGGFMDSHSRFWAITTKGMVEFKGNRFSSYPLSDSQTLRWVFQIFETKAGQLWSLTNTGVYQFHFNKWIKINLYPGYEHHACRNIIETNEGLYINYGDLLVLKTPSGLFKIVGSFQRTGYYYNTLNISGGQIFISTLDGMYEIKHQQLSKLPGALGKLKGLYTYFRDSKKRFWIGTEKMGIQKIEAYDTNHFTTIYKRTMSFNTHHFSEDNHGNIWASSGAGLIRLSEIGFKIFERPGITGKNILRNVLQPPTGPLIINDGTLTLQMFENGVFTNKKLRNPGNTPLPNNELIIDAHAFDDKNRYWYQVRGMALVMQDGDRIYEQSSPMAHLGDEVFDVLFDVFRKRIIVAVDKQKFPCQFNDTSYSVLTMANNIEVKGNIIRLYQSVNGSILFGTDQGLIYSIDKQNTCKLQLNEFGTQGVISKFYNDLSTGDTWIIYKGRGLRRYSWQKDSLIFKEQITKINGLPNDNISSLSFDNRSNLWVCTNSNVAVLSRKNNASDKESYKIVSLFDAEDLQMKDTYGPGMTKDKKGNIWLFSNQHLICFYPDKINYKPPTPSIVIENVELNLRQTKWSNYVDSLSGIFQLPYNLKLSHQNNTLGIYFKGISPSGTDAVKYSYQLKGLEDSWTIPSSNDFVSFVRLPAGKYVFKVKAQLPNTNWSEPAFFSFEIKKAFWQTWWFYLLVGIVLLTGMYLLFRYRLQQKINLFEMRNRLSRDLHDEIGASISGINLLSQIAAEKLHNNKPEEASEYIFKVKNYSKDVIEKLGDMVWIFNPQNDSLEKLVQRLKSFSLSIASSKNIKIYFNIDKESEERNLSINQRKAIYLISKEAINNAFKYATCNYINYTIHVTGSKFRLKIQDNGKGFGLDENKGGNGLQNMQARADEIGAQLTIKSKLESGTTIFLEL